MSVNTSHCSLQFSYTHQTDHSNMSLNFLLFPLQILNQCEILSISDLCITLNTHGSLAEKVNWLVQTYPQCQSHKHLTPIYCPVVEQQCWFIQINSLCWIRYRLLPVAHSPLHICSESVLSLKIHSSICCSYGLFRHLDTFGLKYCLQQIGTHENTNRCCFNKTYFTLTLKHWWGGLEHLHSWCSTAKEMKMVKQANFLKIIMINK